MFYFYILHYYNDLPLQFDISKSYTQQSDEPIIRIASYFHWENKLLPVFIAVSQFPKYIQPAAHQSPNVILVIQFR